MNVTRGLGDVGGVVVRGGLSLVEGDCASTEFTIPIEQQTRKPVVNQVPRRVMLISPRWTLLVKRAFTTAGILRETRSAQQDEAQNEQNLVSQPDAPHMAQSTSPAS